MSIGYRIARTCCMSTFDRHCEFILKCFNKKWNWRYNLSRADYVRIFSTENWNKMSIEDKQKHSLSNCNECAKKHSDLQHLFPGLPYYEPKSEPTLVRIDLPCSSTSVNKSELTQKVFGDIVNTYESTFECSFSDTVVKYSKDIVYKDTPIERKTRERNTKRSLVSAINDTFAENAAISFLAENESFEQYQRNRLSQSFEQTADYTPKPKKRHINDSFVDRYKDIVVEKLREWPVNDMLNWSEIARQCGMSENNAGQKVKEVATECGIDLTQYKQLKSSESRKSKCKLPGGEISVPSMPTLTSLKQDIQKLIDSGMR